MDQLDKKIDEYIQGLIVKCLQSNSFASLPESEKAQIANKLEDYFAKIIVEIVIRRMNEEQFSQIENLQPESQEMADKIQEIAMFMPGLSEDIEEKLDQETANILQTGSIPQ